MGCPQMPPAAFTASTPSCHPLAKYGTACAPSPVVSARPTILMPVVALQDELDPPAAVVVVPPDADFLLELPHAPATMARTHSTTAKRLIFNRFPLLLC